MDEPSDAELVEAYTRTGELSHFDNLLQRHIQKVRSMIYAMVLNDADADELTQDVFMRVIAGIKSFEGRSAFSTWLYRIAMNTTHTFLKRKIRNPVEIHENPPELQLLGGLPMEKMIGLETDARITAALAELSPVLRSAITLTGIHGMDVRQAAKVERCLAATMYWRVHQARKILHAKLLERGVL